MVRKIALWIAGAFLLFGNYNFKDITELFIFMGNKISPTYPIIGTIIFSFFLIFSSFPDETLNLIKRIKVKDFI